MLFRRKFKGAIGYFKLEKFWSKLTEHERQMVKQASDAGLSLEVSLTDVGDSDAIDSGEFSAPFRIDGKKQIPLNTPIDYFSKILPNLLNSADREKAELFIKWYEYLIKKFPKVNDIWSLYFFHMSAMKAYKSLDNIPKAVEAAEANLQLALKLSRSIKKSALSNPCYEFLCYYYSKKEINDKKSRWLRKIAKRCGWNSC
ncbi:hypothetical protein [Thermosipho sp. 1074]|uniref:hypothetical protein n=1 Tax=Thermosipho sp. 1074 TaxID=1643331 RepID=UPI0009871487|nr:hypothetical protein [Thermosipho sp. 1074]OOC42154.1 hypothetical protein XO08_07660 [Thermosipho sp. 1074]